MTALVLVMSALDGTSGGLIGATDELNGASLLTAKGVSSLTLTGARGSFTTGALVVTVVVSLDEVMAVKAGEMVVTALSSGT